jgi:hypothetical protein
MATTKISNKWYRNAHGGRFAYVNGHKVSELACGTVVVERVNSDKMPVENTGTYGTVAAALASIGANPSPTCPQCQKPIAVGVWPDWGIPCPK